MNDCQSSLSINGDILRVIVHFLFPRTVKLSSIMDRQFVLFENGYVFCSNTKFMYDCIMLEHKDQHKDVLFTVTFTQ